MAYVAVVSAGSYKEINIVYAYSTVAVILLLLYWLRSRRIQPKLIQTFHRFCSIPICEASAGSWA